MPAPITVHIPVDAASFLGDHIKKLVHVRGNLHGGRDAALDVHLDELAANIRRELANVTPE